MGDTVRDELPSVFVHGLAFPVAMSVMVRADFPLPLLGMVHLRNHVEHRRVIDPAESLSITAWAEGLDAHYAGLTVDVVAEVSAGDEVVWRGVSTYLAKGHQLDGVVRPDRPERPDWQPPAKTGLWRLGTDTGRQYARVLGDWNPIHLTAASAKMLGLKRHIVHGMYAAGRALTVAVPRVVSDGGGYDWDIDFVAPVFLPGTVQFSAATASPEASTGDTVEFAGWKRGADRPHFVGSVTPR
nr:MaoC/PaaZ C-terminal domain-containing protein [Zhihengliuella flava]